MNDELLFTPRTLGFVRVAAISPAVRIAEVDFNVQAIEYALYKAAAQGASLAVFPELCLTAYTCADLLHQAQLLNAALKALDNLAMATDTANIAAVVGLPLAVDGKLFNCAALLSAGKIVGIVPKTYLPSTQEFYEERWFSSSDLTDRQWLVIGREAVPFGADLVFEAEGFAECVLGIEICEDLWAVEPPSGGLALAGATVLLNPSASNEVLDKASYRRELVRHQSARCLAAYVYAGAGAGESTTDTVWAGHSLIAEYGTLMAETERFQFETQMVLADIDCQRLINERLRNNAYASAFHGGSYRRIEFHLPDAREDQEHLQLLRPQLHPMPFVPQDLSRRSDHCREIFCIQSTALARRLRHTGSKHVVIGVSGGLDSTLALLVTVEAFDTLKLDRAGISAITMPGLGTTDRTLQNASSLATRLGVTLRSIPIVDAVSNHFRDIGHDEHMRDVTYENAQARERMQILMDVGNQVRGFVVGTGDLSELALGWATYGGDHLSMYHVNAGVPKTLVRYLISWVAESELGQEVADLLRDIIATPISPELLPPTESGEVAQKTEETIGPYELHDFFLFYTIRHGFTPQKVFALARQAFSEQYDQNTILHWLEVFYHRFFSQQFKRSAMPDGPKVGTVALSPRADWRMPSDASSALWLHDVALLRRQLRS